LVGSLTKNLERRIPLEAPGTTSSRGVLSLWVLGYYLGSSPPPSCDHGVTVGAMFFLVFERPGRVTVCIVVGIPWMRKLLF